MGFFLFILVNATLFVRPSEIVPDLESVPVYELLMITCILVAFPVIWDQFRWESLRERPISVCVLGMLVAITLSHLSHFEFLVAGECATEFSKVVLYYLLLVGLVDSPARLRTLLTCLVAFIVVVAGLALLQYHEVIELSAISTVQQKNYDLLTGEIFETSRLRSTGIFKDPNDLSTILVIGISICAWKLFEPAAGILRAVWLAPTGLLAYAVALTESRGGLLSLLVTTTVLLQSKYGWRRTVPLATISLLALLQIFGGGRQTEFAVAMDQDTGMSRVRLWSEGFGLFKSAPIFGIGQNEYDPQVGNVAHNSFLHCYAELGFFGGTMFFAAFFIPIVSLYKMKGRNAARLDPATQRLRPYLLASTAGYAAAMLSLSRAYLTPTYMILGLSAAFLRCEASAVPLRFAAVDNLLIRRLATASLLFFGGTYVFTRMFVRWD